MPFWYPWSALNFGSSSQAINRGLVASWTLNVTEDGFDYAVEAGWHGGEVIPRSRNEMPGVRAGEMIFALQVRQGDVDIPVGSKYS